MKLLWIIIVFVGGAMLPFQGGLNARLAKSIGSPAYASMFCFIVGAIAMSLYLQFTKETITWTGIKSASVYSWLGGGLLGAFFITATMLAIPRIGMGLTFGLVVAGQVVISVLLDHFNVLVAQQHSLNIWRTVGILLILAGTVVLSKY